MFRLLDLKSIQNPFLFPDRAREIRVKSLFLGLCALKDRWFCFLVGFSREPKINDIVGDPKNRIPVVGKSISQNRLLIFRHAGDLFSTTSSHLPLIQVNPDRHHHFFGLFLTCHFQAGGICVKSARSEKIAAGEKILSICTSSPLDLFRNRQNYASKYQKFLAHSVPTPP